MFGSGNPKRLYKRPSKHGSKPGSQSSKGILEESHQLSNTKILAALLSANHLPGAIIAAVVAGLVLAWGLPQTEAGRQIINNIASAATGSTQISRQNSASASNSPISARNFRGFVGNQSVQPVGPIASRVDYPGPSNACATDHFITALNYDGSNYLKVAQDAPPGQMVYIHFYDDKPIEGTPFASKERQFSIPISQHQNAGKILRFNAFYFDDAGCVHWNQILASDTQPPNRVGQVGQGTSEHSYFLRL
jgi:hypothetical protein